MNLDCPCCQPFNLSKKAWFIFLCISHLDGCLGCSFTIPVWLFRLSSLVWVGCCAACKFTHVLVGRLGVDVTLLAVFVFASLLCIFVAGLIALFALNLFIQSTNKFFAILIYKII